MAITGKSYVNITPGKLNAGMPEVLEIAEASSETGLRGDFVKLASGYVTAASVGDAIYGFMEAAQSNGASDGASNARVYRAAPGRLFKGTLKATLTQAMIGSNVALSRGSSTAYLDTATATSTHNAQVVGPARGFAVGDGNPEVYFIVLADKIQGDT